MSLQRARFGGLGPGPQAAVRIAVLGAAVLLVGAVLLAFTRAGALLLDLAALGICF